MPLPNVSIEILNNQLGQTEPSDDATCGLVVSGVAAAGLAISTPVQIFTLKEAVDKGIDASYDTTNTTDVYKNIKEFYDRAGSGKELWIMIIPKTTTMATACDVANDIVKKLLNAASGRIRFWGIGRIPDGGYVQTVVDGLDDDVNAAVLKAHALNTQFALEFKPCRAIIGGRGFQGVPGNLRNFRANTNNRVQVTLLATENTGKAAVGFLLGQYANRPLQRKISRVKDGDIGILAGYMTNGQTVETYESAWNSIHDKGYVFARKFVGKSGYYLSSDPMCCPASDDYSSFARCRLMDEAHRITYRTYVEEIEDDLDVDDEGYLAPAVVKSYQQKIVNALKSAFVPGKASAVSCEIDPKQNLLSTNKVVIKKVGVRPKGYASEIAISLGFTNPLNS